MNYQLAGPWPLLKFNFSGRIYVYVFGFSSVNPNMTSVVLVSP